MDRSGRNNPNSAWLDQTDTALLADCQVDVYRARGPGGQHRNKTSSAVRLRHGPTGLIVIATESRSQHENRTRALRRLRQAIALNQRTAVDLSEPVPTFLADALGRDSTLQVNRKHDDYWHIVQYVLDVLFVCEGRISEAAQQLDISTGKLNRFVKRDTKLWEHTNRMRQSFGHPPIR